MAWAASQAAAPLARSQAPGFYRLMLGDIEITALSDGVFDLQTNELLTDTTPSTARLLTDSFHEQAVPTSVNAYLVNTGSHLILVDSGAAKLFGPTLGGLLANLAASGYRPEQVDTVLITHMHPDHIGGLMSDGRMVFPNATLLVEQKEADYWLSAAAREAAPAERKAFFDGAVACVGPYASAGRFKPFVGPANLLPGIRAIPAPGHTPGHTLYAVESKGQRIVFWGDLMEVASVQFVEPTVTIAFDSDGHEAVRQRMRAYEEAARGRYLVAGAHLPFPGIGHLRSEGHGYSWVSIDYNTMR
jgi:glyoxylase-like metal-dependent hydrolase (beta-lactamase superfamily II)